MFFFGFKLYHKVNITLFICFSPHKRTRQANRFYAISFLHRLVILQRRINHGFRQRLLFHCYKITGKEPSGFLMQARLSFQLPACSHSRQLDNQVDSAFMQEKCFSLFPAKSHPVKSHHYIG
jgi:hypothetical protein